jgi:beta-glucosidase
VIDSRLFFAAGRPGSGWHWTAGEDAQFHEMPGGIGKTSSGVLRMSATDRAAQEDARQLTWSGTGAASVGLAARTTVDLQRETNGQLSLGFDYRVDHAPTADVSVQMQCGPGCRGSFDLARALSGAQPGLWSHAKIPLLCFAKAGADMARITQPFTLSSTGQLGLSVTNIRLETGNDAVMPCNP